MIGIKLRPLAGPLNKAFKTTRVVVRKLASFEKVPKRDWIIPLDRSETAVARQKALEKKYCVIDYPKLPSEMQTLDKAFFKTLEDETNALVDHHCVSDFEVIKRPSDEHENKRSLRVWSRVTMRNFNTLVLAPVPNGGLMDSCFNSPFSDPIELSPHLNAFVVKTGSLFLSSISDCRLKSGDLGVQLLIRTLTHQPGERSELSIPIHRDSTLLRSGV